MATKLTPRSKPKTIRKAWVAALRSNKYKQGAGNLKDVYDNYCCLGVLNDLAEKAGIVKSSRVGEIFIKYTAVNDPSDTHGAYLPKVVQEWANMKDIGGAGINIKKSGYYVLGAHGYTTFRSLTSLNDAKVPFKDIADIIENEDGLFNI